MEMASRARPKKNMPRRIMSAEQRRKLPRRFRAKTVPRRIGRLTVLGRSDKNVRGAWRYELRCDCGDHLIYYSNWERAEIGSQTRL
jgi:hypothetical protein